MTIDLNDPNALNRFHAIEDVDVALEIMRGIIDGKQWPQVTLWRLYSYIENAELYGKLRAQKEQKA